MRYIVEYGSNQQNINRIESNSRDAKQHGQKLLGDAGGSVYVALKSGRVISHARYTSENGGRWFNAFFDHDMLIG